jgi:hypothetical protein
MATYSQESWYFDRLRASCATELRVVARRMFRQQELARAPSKAESMDAHRDWRLGETRMMDLESTQLPS